MEKKLNKKSIYSAPVDSPGSWLLLAMELKMAADKLDILKLPLKDHRTADAYPRAYRLLMGLSFENLIKGIIILNKINGTKKPITEGDINDLMNHELEILAKKIPQSGSITLLAEDFIILEEFTPYIVWAGRYPLQKGYGFPVIVGNEKEEYKISNKYGKSLILWEKMAEYLRKESWIIKGEGKSRSRLYVATPANPRS
ncbi:MAG: hypothetical protein WAU28_04585 [Candidatus Moraniibacteriota bacterium]